MSGATIPPMVTMLVVAPDIPAEIIMDLSSSLATEFNTAVASNGSYGVGKKKPAIWTAGVSDLVAKLDSLHFWTIVKLSLGPVMVKAGNKVVDRMTDIAIDWAVKHVTAGKKAKIQIYGPDNQLIKEIDALYDWTRIRQARQTLITSDSCKAHKVSRLISKRPSTSRTSAQ